MRAGRGTGAARLIFLLMVLAAGPAVAAQAEEANRPSGLPVPRFVSIKSEKVNVRSGPTRTNEVSWVYTRVGLPVEIIAEYDNWRRIRDWQGGEGWVLHSLLSGKRTALVTPAAKGVDDFVPIHASPDLESAITARLQAGVVAAVKHCDGHWCRIAGEGYDGWIEQPRLWGVYRDEKVE
jgi:SH3-like domain-containing protein